MLDQNPNIHAKVDDLAKLGVLGTNMVSITFFHFYRSIVCLNLQVKQMLHSPD